jgi:hypothetical protein
MTMHEITEEELAERCLYCRGALDEDDEDQTCADCAAKRAEGQAARAEG